MNSETENKLSTEGRVIFELLQDQISAQRLAISWLMAQVCPDESRDWLKTQQREMGKSSNLSDMAIELKELAEDLEEIINQNAKTHQI